MLFNSKKISPIFTTSMTYLPTPKSPNPLYSIIYIYLNGHTYFRKIFIKKNKNMVDFFDNFLIFYKKFPKIYNYNICPKNTH